MNNTSSTHAPQFPIGIARSILACLATAAFAVHAANAPVMLDDYSDPKQNKNGIDRILVDDKTVGSSSKATQSCEKGILSVKGDLLPGRGVPAFISLVSLLTKDGKPRDMSQHQGIRLRVKVTKGILCVQVASADITNFDFHTGTPIKGKGTEFQEIRVPFTEMKRAWSEQSPLNLKTLTSVNLVSFGMARDSFAYEVDELGFY